MNTPESLTFKLDGAELTVSTDALFRAWLAKTIGTPVDPSPLALPEMKPGERYVGAIISADGSKCEHIILLPGERENVNWDDATAWALSIGGDLPNRCESALLFAAMKDEFKPEWYWTNEQPSSNPDYAWSQTFGNGGQNYIPKSYQNRARAIRRSKILRVL